jgi:hypothetical protein
MSGIDIQSGIVFFEGWYRTGTPPEIRQPVAEIYTLSAADEPLEYWFLEQQERLSHAPRWKDGLPALGGNSRLWRRFRRYLRHAALGHHRLRPHRTRHRARGLLAGFQK